MQIGLVALEDHVGERREVVFCLLHQGVLSFGLAHIVLGPQLRKTSLLGYFNRLGHLGRALILNFVHNIRVALCLCPLLRCLALSIHCIYVDALLLQQKCDHLATTLMACDVQRREAVLIHLVDVDALLPQQHFDHLMMALFACDVQRRGTDLIRPVDIDAPASI